MKAGRTWIFLICTAAGASSVEAPRLYSFDGDATGKPPTGWSAGSSGSSGAEWTVEKNPRAPSPPNVLSEKNPSAGVESAAFVTADGALLLDGTLQVKFKV